MVHLLLALLASPAHAASLDLVDVGGPFGTPGADDPTAVWWNPAGLSTGSGTRLYLEGAPVFARISFDRDSAVEGGLQEYTFFGVAPFVGLATDAGVDGLGIGAALIVPQARGASTDDPTGPGRSSLVEANIQVIQPTLAVSYEIADVLSLGASVGFAHSTWSGSLDTEYATALYDETALLTGSGDVLGYTDATVEDPEYNARADFQELVATGVVFGAGISITPVDMITIAASYNHGWNAVHEGTAAIGFGCPPSSDPLGRLGAELKGLCDADATADASVTYRYPSRIHAGVVVRPSKALRLEGMGGYTFWSAYKDLDVVLDNVTKVTDGEGFDADTAEKLGKDRKWARDGQNTWWAGVDAKYTFLERFTVGGRALFDKASTPDHAMSPNNYDADTIHLGGLVSARPLKWLELGVSYNHQLALPRTITTNAFSVAIDPTDRVEDRWFYPTMNGTYRTSIGRVGIQIRGQFDHKKGPKG